MVKQQAKFGRRGSRGFTVRIPNIGKSLLLHDVEQLKLIYSKADVTITRWALGLCQGFYVVIIGLTIRRFRRSKKDKYLHILQYKGMSVCEKEGGVNGGADSGLYYHRTPTQNYWTRVS